MNAAQTSCALDELCAAQATGDPRMIASTASRQTCAPSTTIAATSSISPRIAWLRLADGAAFSTAPVSS